MQGRTPKTGAIAEPKDVTHPLVVFILERARGAGSPSVVGVGKDGTRGAVSSQEIDEDVLQVDDRRRCHSRDRTTRRSCRHQLRDEMIVGPVYQKAQENVDLVVGSQPRRSVARGGRDSRA